MRPTPQPFRVVEHEWIPVRDGVRLSARLWLPEGAAPSAAVMECIPYRKRDLYRSYDDSWGAVLAGAGIAFVRIDTRGTGDSEGVLTDEYTEAELEDCVEAIAWVARQPWCTGSVGMRGLSWGGINTLQVAARRPPNLKAIMPMGCCDNRYTDDAHYIGGTLSRPNFQWGVLFKTVMASPPDPEIVGAAWLDMWQARLRATPAILAEWLQHQRYDSYWRRGSVAEDYRQITIPTYLVSGWGDTYATPVFRLAAELTAPVKVTIGPWGHTYPNLAATQGLDWANEEVKWWRHWLVGDDTRIMEEPRLRCFMPYAVAAETAGDTVPGRWITEPHIPKRLATRQFYLNNPGLGDTPVRGNPIVHRDRGIVGTATPEWLDQLPMEQSADDALSTIFDSRPLDKSVEILGLPKVRLVISSDTPVANVVLRLCEVRPGGQSWLVSWAVLNLTRRDSISEPSPLERGRVHAVDLDLRATAHRFSPGSRVRLSLSEGWWPILWPSPVTPTLRLAAGLSTLELPVRSQATPLSIEPWVPAADEKVRKLLASDADGRVRIVTERPASVITIPGDDVELTMSRREVCEIRTGDPLSSRWEQTARSSWRRKDWSCDIEASYELFSDGASFRLKESLQAWYEGKDVITVRNETRIPRDLM